MKKTILILLLAFLSNIAFAQQREAAEKLVSEGVNYHDKGDYSGAIARYDKALELDKDNLLALTEKAFSLLALEKYDESIRYCQKAIEKHPGESNLRNIYVNYGNALDGLKKTDQSIEMYEKGISQFPDYYQLYFNKGVTLSSIKKYDEAILCFQQAVTLNPLHAGSHNALGRLLSFTNKKIPSLLAFCTLLIIEPQGDRAKTNLSSLQKIMNGNVQEKGENSIQINLDLSSLGDTAANGKAKENNFSTTELILSLSAGLDFDKKNKSKSDTEKFIRKFETVCSSFKESKEKNYGFYWDHYVPYFIAIQDKKMIEPFSYIVFASSDDPSVAKWLNDHKNNVDEFYEWSKSFKWNTK